MDFERDGDVVTVHLNRDFNLLVARHLRHLAADAAELRIDMAGARLADSEAVIALYRIRETGTRVTLENVPTIFEEVLEVLEMKDVAGKR